MSEFLNHHFIGLFFLICIIFLIIDNVLANFARAKIIVAAYKSGMDEKEKP